MTKPGWVQPPTPGWWVRRDKVATFTDQYGWLTSVSGLSAPAGGISSTSYGWGQAFVGAAPSTFDALGAGNSGNGINPSWSHTATPGAAVIVWAFAANNVNNSSVTATYAGNAMTQRGSTVLNVFDGTFWHWAYCFSYPAALSGAQTIVVTPAASSFVKGNSISYENVSTFGTPVSNTGTAASMTLSSVPSAVGNIVSNMFSLPFTATTPTAYNQTSRWNDNTTGGWTPATVLLGDAPGAATVSFSATQAAPANWVAMAIDLS